MSQVRTHHRLLRAAPVAALFLLGVVGCAVVGSGSRTPCATSDDCPNGEHCNQGLEEPVCLEIRSVIEDEPCTPGEALCDTGLACLPASGTVCDPLLDRYSFTCSPALPSGAECCSTSLAVQCEDGLQCKGDVCS